MLVAINSACCAAGSVVFPDADTSAGAGAVDDTGPAPASEVVAFIVLVAVGCFGVLSFASGFGVTLGNHDAVIGSTIPFKIMIRSSASLEPSVD